MKRHFVFAALILSLGSFSGCGKKGNNYKVHFKALRQNTQPAVGFSVDAWVKDLSQPETKLTDANGMAEFDDLPTPDSHHSLVTVLHYYNGQNDDSRTITYPFIPSDAKRLKDTQYIPNMVTPAPAVATGAKAS